MPEQRRGCQAAGCVGIFASGLLHAPTIQPFEPISHFLRTEGVNQSGQSPDCLSDRKHLLREDNDAAMRSPLCNPSLVQWNEIANVISYQNTARLTRRFRLRFTLRQDSNPPKPSRIQLHIAVDATRVRTGAPTQPKPGKIVWLTNGVHLNAEDRGETQNFT